MANKLETIAAKKKQAELAKQEAEVTAFAKKVADEIVDTITVDTTDDLKNSVAELAQTVAQTIVAANATIDLSLKDSFTQLVVAIKENKPDNTSQVKLSKEIGKSLAKFETALSKIEFAPEITVEGLKEQQLKTEVDKILAKLPSNTKRNVTIAYEQATADKYLNVRLTDGIKFYSAFAGGGGGGSSSTTNYTTRIETVGTLTYIGNAAIGSSEANAVWQIKRLETPGLTKLWADGNDLFDNIWANRASLGYL